MKRLELTDLEAGVMLAHMKSQLRFLHALGIFENQSKSVSIFIATLEDIQNQLIAQGAVDPYENTKPPLEGGKLSS